MTTVSITISCGIFRYDVVAAVSTFDHSTLSLRAACVTAGFCRGVNETFALLEGYAALIGSYRRFGPETSVTINQRCVTSQKSEGLKTNVVYPAIQHKQCQNVAVIAHSCRQRLSADILIL